MQEARATALGGTRAIPQETSITAGTVLHATRWPMSTTTRQGSVLWTAPMEHTRYLPTYLPTYGLATLPA